jgi:hypothetical protein
MPSDAGDIAAALAYQVKKEIAENYFGTRRLLEEEREAIVSRARKLLRSWEKEVLPPLIQVGQLLMSEPSIQAFLGIIRREDLFPLFKKGLAGQKLNQTPITCSPSFALTVRGKYRNLVFATYALARQRIKKIAEDFQKLEKQVALFNEDLAKFNASFCLSEILSFIKALDGVDGLKGVLGENMDPRAVPLLEEKLTLRPLQLSREGLLPPSLSLPSLKEIKGPLGPCLDEAYLEHCSEIKEMMENRF